LPAKQGKIIDVDTAKPIGVHQGVLYYTLGQRKGLDVHAHEGPWFVCGKDIHKNELYVVKGEAHPLLKTNTCRLIDINWFNPDLMMTGMDVKAKFRYRQKDQAVHLRIENNETYVDYPQGIAAVTPGQEAVFYIDDVCLGGGVIDEIFMDDAPHAQRIQEALNV